MPFHPTRRAAGLGNELIPWAKAFIASRELGARLLHPAWGLNARGYRHDFGTSRYDWLAQLALAAMLPRVEFSESDYAATGATDYASAIRSFADRSTLGERAAYVLVTDGLWGGFQALETARAFILGELLRARAAQANLYAWARALPRDKLTVAVHIRLGDFRSPAALPDYRGTFNTAIPLEWYAGVCRLLRERFGSRVQFALHSDGAPSSLDAFVREFAPFTTAGQRHATVSDLLCMASADLLICSVSSYSMWAAFLSDNPYVWFEPQLQNQGGLYSLWGHEKSHGPPNGPTHRNAVRFGELRRSDGASAAAVVPRGLPVGLPAELPSAFLDELEARLARKSVVTDLVRSGVVAASTAP
jgi:hypothetical protein